MTNPSRPTLARRHLGRLLRRLRHEAGKTHEDVRVAGLGSRSKMSLLEAGRSTAKVADIYGLSALYRLSSAQTDQLLTLAEASRRTGVRESLDASMPEQFGVYGDLVDAASTLRIHSVELIHGLVRTEDYARAAIATDAELTAGEVEQRVAFWLRRQAAFLRRRRSGRLEVVVTAGSLELVVGSPEVTARQLAHLRSLDATDDVDVRVLTATDGVHPWMRGGGFTLMEFDDPEEPPVACVENLVEARYFERSDQVAVHRRAFGRIVAMSVPIREVRIEYG